MLINSSECLVYHHTTCSQLPAEACVRLFNAGTLHSFPLPAGLPLMQPAKWWEPLEGTELAVVRKQLEAQMEEFLPQLQKQHPTATLGDLTQSLCVLLSCSVPVGSEWVLLPSIYCHEHLGHTATARWVTTEGNPSYRLTGEGPLVAIGDLTTAEQMWRYGKCLVDDTKTYLLATVEVPATDLEEMKAAKQRLLQRLGLPTTFRLTDTLPVNLLSSLRLLMATEWEFYFYQYSSTQSVPRISHWNELKVLKCLKALATVVLTSTPPPTSTCPSPALYSVLEGADAYHHYRRTQRACAERILRAAQSLCDAFCEPVVVSDLQTHHIVTPISNWFEQHWGPLPVTIFEAQDGKGRGLLTATHINAGTPLLSIPLDAVISVDVARQSQWGSLYQQLSLDDDNTLVLFVIHELNNPYSKWAPFWDAVPKQYDTPMLWSVTELLELESCTLLDDTVQAKDQLRQSYDALFPRLTHQFPTQFPADLFTYAAFLHVRCIFDSRSFKMNIDGRPLTCLIPVADMVNHYPDGNVAYRSYNPATRSIEFTCLRDLPPNAEVRMNYGLMQNWETLLYYGFLDPTSPTDSFHFSIAPNSDDEHMCNLAERLLSSFELPLEHFLPHTGHHPVQLLAALRVCVLEEEDLPYLKGWDPTTGRTLSPSNESRMQATLAATLQMLLDGFPTTLQEDQAALTADLTSHARLAVMYRVSQKLILTRALALVKMNANRSDTSSE
eukprot:NODE_448_length_2226_cov_55.958552_g416_i0.p1 GENE.NODE_448_length_2226_cov_55.958552_g416_i0~~NODE_448_length_2226_cov_55.958552_g416_i0.p1  ORF type:complete len:736 (-),score=223.88 NODE_448_length_2226_cov_55.958552_g416_i0:18-2189(-)